MKGIIAIHYTRTKTKISQTVTIEGSDGLDITFSVLLQAFRSMNKQIMEEMDNAKLVLLHQELESAFKDFDDAYPDNTPQA